MIRLFVSNDLAAGVGVEPKPDQARYLTAVMRLGAGAEIALFNGRDGEWLARISEVSRRGCHLVVREMLRPQDFPPDLELVVALVKRGPLETIVEKATELGVRTVRLTTTRRTNADHVKLPRLQAIATEAAEQTGRLDVPEVIEPKKLLTLLDSWDPARKLMFCDESGDDDDAEWGGPEGRARPLLQAMKSRNAAENAAQHEVQHKPQHIAQDGVRHGGPWAVLIGPEGGFDPEERGRLRGLSFVTAVTLGPRILRADTAAIAALALWQAAVGDWRS